MSSILLLAAAASQQPAKPTEGLLSIENIDCISSQISDDRAQVYYRQVRQGEEIEAFEAEQDITQACQIAHQWSDLQTRNAFRIAVFDGWMLDEGLLENIQSLGDHKHWLDQYYDDAASSAGRHIWEDAFQSGALGEKLTAEGYPKDEAKREWVYGYFEWRDSLRGIEDDFRNGELRQ